MKRNCKSKCGTADGERLKADALALLEARREVYVLRGRRALLRAMLDGDGRATADDVRAAAESWLRDHPDAPDPGDDDQDAGKTQRVLFAQETATPTGTAAGAAL